MNIDAEARVEVDRIVREKADAITAACNLSLLLADAHEAINDLMDALSNAYHPAYAKGLKVLRARKAMPSQRLDAATVERCAQVCDALAEEKRVSIHPKDHPMSGGIIDGMLERAASAYECAATRIRALATEPHQHEERSGS